MLVSVTVADRTMNRVLEEVCCGLAEDFLTSLVGNVRWSLQSCRGLAQILCPMYEVGLSEALSVAVTALDRADCSPTLFTEAASEAIDQPSGIR